jgi:hypothetical protein
VTSPRKSPAVTLRESRQGRSEARQNTLAISVYILTNCKRSDAGLLCYREARVTAMKILPIIGEAYLIIAAIASVLYVIIGTYRRSGHKWDSARTRAHRPESTPVVGQSGIAPPAPG